MSTPAPKRRGRPPSETTRTELLWPLRLRRDQLAAYQAAADRLGVPVSTWAKRLLDTAAGYVPPQGRPAENDTPREKK